MSICVADYIPKSWNSQGEDYVRVYGEFGGVTSSQVAFFGLNSCMQDITGVCMYAYIYATWEDLKKRQLG